MFKFQVTIILVIGLCITNKLISQSITKQNVLTSIKNTKFNGFIKNLGQIKSLEGEIAKDVLFTYTASSDVEVYITNKGISYLYKKLLSQTPDTANRISEKKKVKVFKYEAERVDAVLHNAVIDTNNIIIEYGSSDIKFNYYDQQLEITNQRLIKKIIFKNVYPDVDWILYEKMGDNGESVLKYDFVVNTKINLDLIKIVYSNNAKVSLNKKGQLYIKSKLGYIVEGTPIAFNQHQNKLSYTVNYKVTENIVSYSFKNENFKWPVVIDPDLSWGTFLHTLTPYNGLNSSNVRATCVETDSWDNVFVSLNCSGRINFPTINLGNGAYFNNIYDSVNGNDVFMKFNPKGVLLWSTYFSSGGHFGLEDPLITVDKEGNLIVASTYYKQLPRKNNGGYFNTTTDDIYNKYLAKFSNNGHLIWSTPWSVGALQFLSIIHDSSNNFYVGGFTNFDALPRKDYGNGAFFNNTPYSSFQSFVSKFDKNCNLIWSTDFPSNNQNAFFCRLNIDMNNNLYVSGGLGVQRFDTSCKVTWSPIVPGGGTDIAIDTALNVFCVGGSPGGASFPYTNPGNGAYMDPNPTTTNFFGGGSIVKYDKNKNLVWATTFKTNMMFDFERIVYEKYRNIIHVMGYMNNNVTNFPTVNDECNGNFYYPSTLPNTHRDFFLISFDTKGKLLYSSLGGFPYANYQYSQMTVDTKGNLYFVFPQIQESPAPYFSRFLKDPGNGAYYQGVSNNYMSYGSVLMKLKPTKLNTNVAIIPPIDCNCNGSIDLTPLCGTGNYRYSWSRGDTTKQIQNLCTGNYWVSVTDLNSYADTLIQFSFPNPPNAINGASILKTNDFCNKSTGSLKLTGTGGSLPYQYSFNNQPFSNANTFTNLPSGEYSFQIKDNAGCIYKDYAQIDSIAGPTKIFTQKIATSCNLINGQIIIDSIKDGTSPFSFSINNGSWQTSAIFNGLGNHTFLLQVKDSAECILKDTVIIPLLSGPDSFKVTLDNQICGQTNGSIKITPVFGGQRPYLYSLDNQNYSTDSLFLNQFSGKKYLYVKDANGCIFKDSLILSFKNYPIINLPSDTILCNQETWLAETFQNGTNINTSYLWQDGSTNHNFLINKAGTYKVTINKNGCIATDSCNVKYLNTPTTNLGNDLLVCEGDTVKLNTSFNESNYLWQDFSISPYYKVFKAGIYYCIVSNFCGSDSDTINVKLQPCKCDTNIPNVFSPNGDGINDDFRPSISCPLASFSIVIFDRAGQVIFESKNSQDYWKGTYKGKKVPLGTYYYLITLKGFLDPTYYRKSGSITVLR